MKLTGYTKETYNYSKEGRQIVGDSYTLYFSYKIPPMMGQGVAVVPYKANSQFSRMISQGASLTLGADYDIILTEGKVASLIPIDRGKEKLNE